MHQYRCQRQSAGHQLRAGSHHWRSMLVRSKQQWPAGHWGAGYQRHPGKVVQCRRIQCGHINNQPVGLYIILPILFRKWLLYDIQPPGRIHVHGTISWRAGSDINSKVNDTGRSIAFSVLPGSTILNMDAVSGFAETADRCLLRY